MSVATRSLNVLVLATFLDTLRRNDGWANWTEDSADAIELDDAGELIAYVEPTDIDVFSQTLATYQATLTNAHLDARVYPFCDSIAIRVQLLSPRSVMIC